TYAIRCGVHSRAHPSGTPGNPSSTTRRSYGAAGSGRSGSQGGRQFVEPAEDPGEADVVHVVARFDDDAVPYPGHDDAGSLEGSAVHRADVAELVDDHLRVGGLVDLSHGRVPVRLGNGSFTEVPVQVGAGAQGRIAEWRQRVPDVGLFGV